MLNFLKKFTPNVAQKSEVGTSPSNISHLESTVLSLKGLHCTSCAVDIDLTLEDLPGVKATTNYAKSETKIEFDPTQTTIEKIKSTISALGYSSV